MKLTVFSHKPCWSSKHSPTGYATDGGFPFQMKALSEIFDQTRLVVPCAQAEGAPGEIPLTGHQMVVVPLTPPRGTGLRRKIGLLGWLLRNTPALVREVMRADAVHAPIPGDIGTIGMVLAWIFRKPLFIRHCGNWFVQKTTAERFWKWFMERFAGGRNVMLTTGGNAAPPSATNEHIKWIFSTSLTTAELRDCSVGRELVDRHRARLIIVCRQERKKGVGIVIESLPLLLRDFPRLQLDVVGDGAALSEFQAMAREQGVMEHVTFHGKLDHDGVIRLLRRADLFCYPTSASEGFPKVVLEALACGLPVITTPVSVLPMLMAQGGGCLLDEATPTALAGAVTKALMNPEHYREMSQQALDTASKFSLERWRDEIQGHLMKAWGASVDGRFVKA